MVDLDQRVEEARLVVLRRISNGCPDAGRGTICNHCPAELAALEAAIAERAVAHYRAELNAVLDELRDWGNLDAPVNNLRRGIAAFLAAHKEGR